MLLLEQKMLFSANKWPYPPPSLSQTKAADSAKRIPYSMGPVRKTVPPERPLRHNDPEALMISNNTVRRILKDILLSPPY